MAAAPPAAPKKAVPSRDTATLTAYYWEAYNEIVQPSRINVYLIDKWLPDLGPVGFALVQALRRRCYHNPKTGETRSEILVDMNTLGTAIGVSDSTVQRELKRNEALKQFVKVAPQYETQGSGKAPKRFMPAFEIAMDDPIHPSDMERYDALRAQKEAERVRSEEDRARAVQGSKYRVRGPSSAGASTATGGVQNPPKIHYEFKAESGQNEAQNGLENVSDPKIQNEFKGDAKIQIDAPKTQNDAPKTQNEVDAPYISSSLFSLPDSLHAADGASPAINSDPKGRKRSPPATQKSTKLLTPLWRFGTSPSAFWLVCLVSNCRRWRRI